MKTIFSIMALLTGCVIHAAEQLTVEQRAAVELRAASYAARVADALTPSKEVTNGITTTCSRYAGPKGSGRLIHVWFNDGKTNRLVKIIDQGPDGRGRDYP